MAGSCGADVAANGLKTSLTTDVNYEIVTPDLSDSEYQIPSTPVVPVSELTNNDLTTRTVGGSGTFDAIMASVNAHIKDEYEKGRITGSDYTTAYIELTSAALSSSVSFLLGKDQAYYQAVLAQNQARLVEVNIVKARVELEQAKAALAIAQYQAVNAEAEYANLKMRLAIEDANYCILLAQKEKLTYENAEILPLQKISIEKDNSIKTEQEEGIVLDNNTKQYNLSNIITKQAELLTEQIQAAEKDTEIKDYNLTDILPNQKKLLLEQVEVQRAQTMNTRTDGATIVGQLGKQKDLYTQQITSYQRDAEVKAAKLWVDAWITQKTIDDGLLPPDQFTNTEVNEVLSAVKAANNLGTI